MKILVTSIVDLKKSQHNRIHQIVKHLSEKHDVTVISINDWWKGKQNNISLINRDFNDVFNRIKYYYLTEREISPVLQELFMRKKLRKLLRENRFDVHLNYNTLITGSIIVDKINTVYDIADDLGAMIKESPQIPNILRPIGEIIGNSLIKRNIEGAKKVIITTETLKESYKIPNDKCEVIPNGVDTSLFKDYGNMKEELNLDGFIVGYVGVLREWVDLESVFQALKELDKNIKMVVVGKEGMFGENINLAKKYEVSDRVVFTGTVPYSEVPKYISAMDVCLIPFKANTISYNALPLKLFEYMACKKPVISTEIPGVKHVAGDKVLYASNKDEYKEKILMLFRDEDLRLKMGEEGQKLVEENYNWKNIAKRIERILLDVGSAV